VSAALPLLVVLLVALQRGAELLLARRNTRRLRAAGAVEHGAGHYPLFVLLHATWLAALAVTAMLRPALDLRFLVPFLALQPLRLWIIGTLGERWSTRVLVLPGAPLVAGGPFRFARHPNYMVVALELPLLALALGAPWLAALFGSLNLALLTWRVRVEEAALRSACG
jgi:methyltransferase